MHGPYGREPDCMPALHQDDITVITSGKSLPARRFQGGRTLSFLVVAFHRKVCLTELFIEANLGLVNIGSANRVVWYLPIARSL